MHSVGRMRDFFFALNLTVYIITTGLCRANYELVAEINLVIMLYLQAGN